MSQADELLNSLSDKQIAAYTVDPSTEEHIVVGDEQINGHGGDGGNAYRHQNFKQEAHAAAAVNFRCFLEFIGHGGKGLTHQENTHTAGVLRQKMNWPATG